MTFRFLALGTAALALSACSIPNFTTPEVATLTAAPKPVAAAPKQVATVKTPAPQQVAAQTQTTEAKPANPWAHQRIGNSLDLGENDEDSGWN